MQSTPHNHEPVEQKQKGMSGSLPSDAGGGQAQEAAPNVPALHGTMALRAAIAAAAQGAQAPGGH